jgi:serine protease
MRPRLLLSAAATAAFVAAAPAGAAAAEYVPGEVIVRYERGAAAAGGAGERLPGGAHKVAIRDGESVPETVRDLRERRDVAYAVPNYIAQASAFVPNDPGFGAPAEWPNVQWNFAGVASINAPDAWDLAARAGAPGGRGAIVAVLDTGVAYATRGRFRRAPDLSKATFTKGYDFVAGDPYPNDENGHGTHVAGTIAEATNNGQGVTGLAYGAKIMPLRVLDSHGAGDAVAISRAIRYAASHKANVINMSLEFDSSVTLSQIPEIRSAVRFAIRKGAVITAAAGNEADTAVAYPARTAGVISVAATTEHLCQADYSNSGTGLDVSAPGGGSDAPNLDNPTDLQNCHPGTGGRDIFQQTFTRSVRTFGLPSGFQGTSMASPHVAATAALIIATRRLGPRPSPQAVEQRLKQTARDLGPPGLDNRYGAGLIDAAAAIDPAR